jgi:hypothetical protein
MVKEKVKYPDPLGSELTSKLIVTSLFGKQNIPDYLGVLNSRPRTTISDGLQALRKQQFLKSAPSGENKSKVIYSPNYNRLKKEIMLAQIKHIDIVYFFGKDHFPECHNLLNEANKKKKEIQLKKRYYSSIKGHQEQKQWFSEWKAEYEKSYNEETRKQRFKDVEDLYKSIEKRTPQEIKELMTIYLKSFLTINEKTKNKILKDLIPRIKNSYFVFGGFFKYLDKKKEKILKRNNELEEYFNAMFMAMATSGLEKDLINIYPSLTKTDQEELSTDLIKKLSLQIEREYLASKYGEENFFSIKQHKKPRNLGLKYYYNKQEKTEDKVNEFTSL